MAVSAGAGYADSRSTLHRTTIVKETSADVRQRLIPLIITLALLLPGLVAGGWVGYYYVHQKHTVPYGPLKHTVLLQVPTPRATSLQRGASYNRVRNLHSPTA